MKKLFFAAFLCVLSLSSCHKNNLEERAAKEAQEYTRRECPRPVAENIMQDSMVYESDSRTIVYYYTLNGVLDNKTELQKHIGEYNRELSQSIKSSAALRRYVEAGFRFRYIYRSEGTGDVLLDLKF